MFTENYATKCETPNYITSTQDPSSMSANIAAEEKVPPHASVNSHAKRALDVLGAAILIAVTLPLLIISALLVKATSAGPVIYQCRRPGLYGESFTVLKLRTMQRTANALEGCLLADTTVVFFPKTSKDQRITPVGHILRRLSIDELPQLFNVIKGEMSLVGPRPILEQEAECLPASRRDRRFTVLPGLTGLWQVSGRSKLSDADRIRYDNEYVDKWSLVMDLNILLQTIPVVIFGIGAR